MSSKLTSFRLIFLVVAILFCSASSKTDQEQNNTGFSAQTGSSDSPFHLEASVTKDQNFDKIIVDGIAIGVVMLIVSIPILLLISACSSLSVALFFLCKWRQPREQSRPS